MKGTVTSSTLKPPWVRVGIAAMALPFAAAVDEQVATMGAFDGQVDGRHPGTRRIIAADGAAAFVAFLQVFGLLCIGVGELPAGGIAMIGGDDQTAAGREPFDQRPEGVPSQVCLHFLSERLETLAGVVVIVQAMIRPVVPEYPVRLRADQVGAVCPGDVGGFGSGTRKDMAVPRPIVSQGRALGKPKRLGERSGIRGEFGTGRAGILDGKTSRLCLVQNPRGFAQ